MTYATTKELYSMFLDSDWWRELSSGLRENARCTRCNSNLMLQCHHVRYPENWFDTTKDDLEILCRHCHAKEHGFVVDHPRPRPTRPRRRRKAWTPEPVADPDVDLSKVATIEVLCELRQLGQITKAQFRKRKNEINGEIVLSRPNKYGKATGIFPWSRRRKRWKRWHNRGNSSN